MSSDESKSRHICWNLEDGELCLLFHQFRLILNKIRSVFVVVEVVLAVVVVVIFAFIFVFVFHCEARISCLQPFINCQLPRSPRTSNRAY